MTGMTLFWPGPGSGRSWISAVAGIIEKLMILSLPKMCHTLCKQYLNTVENHCQHLGQIQKLAGTGTSNPCASIPVKPVPEQTYRSVSTEQYKLEFGLTRCQGGVIL